MIIYLSDLPHVTQWTPTLLFKIDMWNPMPYLDLVTTCGMLEYRRKVFKATSWPLPIICYVQINNA